jgi:hypothetical protein
MDERVESLLRLIKLRPNDFLAEVRGRTIGLQCYEYYFVLLGFYLRVHALQPDPPAITWASESYLSPTSTHSAAASSENGFADSSSEHTQIASLHAATNVAVASADAALKVLDALDERHKLVSSKTEALHEQCRTLAETEAKLRDSVDKISKPLAYFESYYVIARRLGVRPDAADAAAAGEVIRDARSLPPADCLALHGVRADYDDTASGWQPLKPSDAEFPSALDRMDECVAWLAAHVSYKDATQSIARYKQLQARALGLVKLAVHDAVTRTATAAGAEMAKALAVAAAAPPGAEMALAAPQLEAAEVTHLHVRWRTELGHLRPLLALVEARAATKRAYADIVRDCHRFYLDRRLALLAEVTRSKLQRFADVKLGLMRRAQPGTHLAAITGAATATGAGRPPPQPGPPRSTTAAAGHAQASTPATAAEGATTPALTPAQLGSAAAPSNGSAAASAGAGGTTAHANAGDALYVQERPLLDAIRSCCSSMARTVQAEAALFNALFIAPPAQPLATPAGRNPLLSPGGAATSTSVMPSTPLTGSKMTISGASLAMPSHLRSTADAALAASSEELCGVLVEVLRPLVLAAGSLDVLCDAVTVLRDEVAGELLLSNAGPGTGAGTGAGGAAGPGPVPALAPLARVVSAFVRDVQERLIFRSQGYIAHVVEGYVPGLGGSGGPPLYPVKVPVALSDGSRGTVTSVSVRTDIDYPVWLFAYYARARTAQLFGGQPGSDKALSTPPPVYDSWFPALERSLTLLSKIYRCVEQQSFDALAQDVVNACTKVLVAASNAIAKQPGASTGSAADAYIASRVSVSLLPSTTAGDDTEAAPAAPAPGSSLKPGLLTRGLLAATVRLGPQNEAVKTSLVDADLFLVKHLLVLREQLSPFEMQLTSTQRTLDFGSTNAAFHTLLSHLSNVLKPSRDNALVSFVASSLPTVSEVKQDAKAELESLLKTACERFIAAAKTLVVGPLVQFLAAHPVPTSDPPNPVQFVAKFIQHARGSADAAHTCAVQSLPSLRRRMGFYLSSPITATVLFKPIREQCSHVLATARNSLAEVLAFDPATADASATPPEAFAVMNSLAAIAQLIEASDQLALDPNSAAFGYDDVTMPGIGKHLVPPAAPSPSPPIPAENAVIAPASNSGDELGELDTSGRDVQI